MNTQPTDVGAILQTLRTEVRARRLSQPTPAEDELQRDLQRALDEIELSRVVSAHWPLLGHNLPTRVIALVNKLVRRYLRWYINPIVEQQNAYNNAIARTLRLLADAYADLAQQATDDRPPTNDKQGLGVRETREEEVSSFIPHPSSFTATDKFQAQIRARARTEPPARFPDLELQAQELQHQLRQNVNAHWPLPAHTPLEKVVAVVNKLVRRYLRWYINPIVEQQNAANAALTAALLAFVRLDAERRASAAARRATKVRMNSE